MSDLDLAAIAKGTGELVVERLEFKIKATWEQLPPEAVKAVRAAGLDLSELLLRKVAGEDVGAELAHVEATIANWAWVGAHRVRTALLEEVKEVAGIVGGALKALLVGLL